MTRLYLVRHGETVDNVNKIMQGQTQGRLTTKGEAQAREVMEKMRTEHIDAFVSSDLKRSIDNMAISPADLVQRKHNYAIVDEVDSVKLLVYNEVERLYSLRHVAVVVLHVVLLGLEHTCLDTLLREVLDERFVLRESLVRTV